MTTETSTSQHYLQFFLPPSTQAMISTEQVMEIANLAPHQIVPIPDVPPMMMGVFNWRGEVVWLVDLGYLLGSAPLFQQHTRLVNYRSLIIQHPQGYLGLVVNRVNESFWCSPDEIQLLSSTQRTTKLSQCLTGYWTNSQSETVWVLDSGAVVETLKDLSG